MGQALLVSFENGETTFKNNWPIIELIRVVSFQVNSKRPKLVILITSIRISLRYLVNSAITVLESYQIIISRFGAQEATV